MVGKGLIWYCLKVMNRYGLKFMKMITKKLEHGCLGMGTSNEHGYEQWTCVFGFG